ncbi:MAG: phosphate ABC transporter permease subunit PstC [Candidatus Latescibacterota bacterium]
MDTRRLTDAISRWVMLLLCLFVLSLTFVMAIGLYQRSRPVLAIRGLRDLLLSSTWHPLQGEFGLASFVVGTLWVTGIAMLIAVPLSLLTAVYLAEYSPRGVRESAKTVIDVLAGISPVVYGVWGITAVVPLVRDALMPFLSQRLPFFPFASENYTGFAAVTGGIVLGVMVFPIIISIAEEVLRSVPFATREASLALGATHWQTTKHVVLREARPALIAAVILGLSRAFGETMAVLMVAGCALHTFPRSIFDTAYPLPALIANTYGEMMSIPLYDAAVLLAALVLLAVTSLFSMVGWGILLRAQGRKG